MIKIIVIILTALALLTAVYATITLLSVPVYQGIETVQTKSGSSTTQTEMTLVEMNGTRVIYLLVGVTLVSGVPFLAALLLPRRQRLLTWVPALLLAVFTILGSLSIGLAYMPGALLLLIAAVLTLFIRRKTDR